MVRLLIIIGAGFSLFLFTQHNIMSALCFSLSFIIAFLLDNKIRQFERKFQTGNTTCKQQNTPLTKSTIKTTIPPQKKALKNEPAQQKACTLNKATPKTKEIKQQRPYQFIFTFLSEGNAVAKVGAIVLFFGIAFLLKYAVQHTVFTLQMRFAFALVLATIFIGLSFKIRHKHKRYSYILQGVGFGVFYLVFFAAYYFYQLMPAYTALFFLSLVAITSCLMAVKQNAYPLIFQSLIAGFLAPVLMLLPKTNLVLFYYYYAVLNFVILAISTKYYYASLIRLGVFFTFVVSVAFGLIYYRSQDFFISEIALIFFFLLYVVINLFAQYKKPNDRLNYGLTFGLPICAFGVQLGLVNPFLNGGAYSAVALMLFYFIAGYCLRLSKVVKWQPLIYPFYALALCFFTLFIPLYFNKRISIASFAIEGFLLIWAGSRQKDNIPQYTGVVLQYMASVTFIFVQQWQSTAQFFHASLFIAVILAISHLASACYLYYQEPYFGLKKMLAAFLFVHGLFWWYFAGTEQIILFSATSNQANDILGFMAISSLIFYTCGERCRFIWLRYTHFLFIAYMICQGIYLVENNLSPLSNYGLIFWPMAFILHFGIAQDHYRKDHCFYLLPLFQLGTWLLALIVFQSIDIYSHHLMLTHRFTNGLWLASLFLLMLHYWGPKHQSPIQKPHALLQTILPFAMIVAGLNCLLNITTNGQWGYYLPLLSVYDILLLGSMFILTRWLFKTPYPASSIPLAIAIAIFVWINLSTVLLRAIVHFTHLPYQWHALFHSGLVQGSLSLYWIIVAVVMMLYAHIKQYPKLWLIGASLATLVVIKLFIIDLANSQTLLRVLSFMTVGLSLLLVGYFAPFPSKMLRAKHRFNGSL